MTFLHSLRKNEGTGATPSFVLSSPQDNDQDGDNVDEFTLPRTGDVDIVFRGELLADVSSEERGMSRWSECRIYRTDSHKFVVETVGKSVLPDEIDLYTVKVVQTADDVKVALRRRDQVEYLTNLALEALEIAAQVDEGIRASLTERV